MKKKELKKQLNELLDDIIDEIESHRYDNDILSDYVKSTSERQFNRECLIVNLCNDENFEQLKFLLIQFNQEQVEALAKVQDVLADDIRIRQLLFQFESVLNDLYNCNSLQDLKDLYNFNHTAKKIFHVLGADV